MSAPTQKYDAKSEQDLMTALWSPEIADDPRAFVRFAFPWGKPGTPLASYPGPRNWQDAAMLEVAKYIRGAKRHLQVTGEVPDMFRKAIVSGRGPGKSALYGMIACWLVSTRIGSSVWVAANGEPQLRTKTFPEIAKWFTMAINAHWWNLMSTKIEPAPWLADLVKDQLKIDPGYWYVAAQLWSQENPDAFAGAHNDRGECYLFDEASGIPRPIWTVAQGVFIEKIIDRYWFVFSNGRRNDGAFFECFHKNRDSWRPQSINCLEVEGLAKDSYLSIIKEFGEDSDEARVEVYGQFPQQDEHQFISKNLVQSAVERVPQPDMGAPLIMGVDVARGGRDYCVLAFRRGRDARSIPWERFKSDDNVKTAERVAQAIKKYGVDYVMIDANGVGSGPADILRSWGYRVLDVQFGSKSSEPQKHELKRDQCWALMKEWLAIGCIPNDDVLKADLTGPWHSWHPVRGTLILESKVAMRERGLASPDEGDALAFTFACPVARLDSKVGMRRNRSRIAEGLHYPLFGGGVR